MGAKPIQKDTPKGAEIIPFAKPAGSGKPPEDWLRKLPLGVFFLSKAKAGVPSQAPFFDRWGVAGIIPEAYLLASPHRNNPTAYEFTWVDTVKFSEVNKFVALLPQVEGEEGEDDG